MDDIFEFDDCFFEVDVSFNAGDDFCLSLFDIESAGIIGRGVAVPGRQQVVFVLFLNPQSFQLFQAYGTH